MEAVEPPSAARIPRSPRSARRSAPSGSATLNDGTHVHRAEAADRAHRERRPGDQPPAAAAGELAGHHRLHAGGAGHHDRRPRRPHAVPVHAVDADAGELHHWAPIFLHKLKRFPASPTSPATRRAPARCSTSRSTATPPRGYGILPAAIDNTLDDAFGQRIVSTMFTTLNQYHVILEVEPQFQFGPQALNNFYVPLTDRTAGADPCLGRQCDQAWRRSSSIIRASSRR